MSTQFAQGGTPINLTSSAAVSKASGTIIGFYVNNKGLNATLVLSHGSVTGGTAITGTITPLIGYYDLKIYCPTGLFATIAVAAMDITFFFAAG
jgi:hypothetical protein